MESRSEELKKIAEELHIQCEEYIDKYPPERRMDREQLCSIAEGLMDMLKIQAESKDYFLRQWESGLEVSVVKLLSLGLIREIALRQVVVELFENRTFEEEFMKVYYSL